jgi:hypothetical protein
MPKNKKISEKVPEGHLKHNIIMAVRITKIMWNNV